VRTAEYEQIDSILVPAPHTRIGSSARTLEGKARWANGSFIIDSCEGYGFASTDEMPSVFRWDYPEDAL
jgi:hypothetical protein